MVKSRRAMRRWRLPGLWLCCAATSGCIPVPQSWIHAHQVWRWTYPPPAESAAAPTTWESLLVVDLVDARPLENDWRLLIALIPLVPYATSTFERPEEALRGLPLPDFEPVADVTSALVAELRAARIFVAVSREPDPNADWVLEGRLLSTRCVKDDIFYGLSILGVVPWLFALPNSVTDNELSVHLTLRRRGWEQPVWSYDLQAADTDSYNAYSSRIDFRFDQLLRSAMPKFLTSLREAVRSNA
jgi:hypothetical protein